LKIRAFFDNKITFSCWHFVAPIKKPRKCEAV